MKAVMVTTKHRGVFFGYVEDDNLLTDTTVELKSARMCVYWPKENHGVLGLASDGPKRGSRVTPAAPSMVLMDITSYSTVTEEAAARWESEPWS